MSRDARVDAFIAAAQPFARPILNHPRAAIHAACPGAAETIVQAIAWIAVGKSRNWRYQR